MVAPSSGAAQPLEPGAGDLAALAATRLAEAAEELSTQRGPGRRSRHRGLLEEAIEHATRALGAAARDDRGTRASALSTLVQALAARAEDALQGAGQLSLSAQRAPTAAACDEGWERVEAIVAGAEEAARMATSRVTELASQGPRPAALRAAGKAARRAEAAARAARRLVEARNHAYTFHADSGFSFGEGWYLAAAAVLAGVRVQLEPDKDGTAKAERFLHDAGLDASLQPYRPRPRAMKHVTEIVGRAFAPDPSAAQSRLRAAFLGSAPVSPVVRDFVDRKLEGATSGRKVLLWIRQGSHHPARNTRLDELAELSRRAQSAGLTPVLIGDDAPREARPQGALDLILFWKDPIFQQVDMRRAQLQLFEHLRDAHALVGQLGVTTAGMDGPALLGLPTTYLTDAPNVRMREWVGRVPGYREIVRESGYLEHVSAVLSGWAAGQR